MKSYHPREEEEIYEQVFHVNIYVQRMSLLFSILLTFVMPGSSLLHDNPV
jgi:hypothetical protein